MRLTAASDDRRVASLERSVHDLAQGQNQIQQAVCSARVCLLRLAVESDSVGSAAESSFL